MKTNRSSCTLPKTKVIVRLEPEQVASLDGLARNLGRDRSHLIKEAIDGYIARRRWRIEEIQKALAEAEAGDFASDEEVTAMFDELSL
jgi:predicted transcriptional regulator